MRLFSLALLLALTLITSCTEVTAPVNTDEKNITEFFWTGAAPLTLTYDLRYVTENRVDRHDMTLQSSTNPHPLLDVSPLGSVTMSCTITDDEVRLANADGLGFFALPVGSYISGSRPRQTVNGALPVRAAATTKKGHYVVTDAGEIYSDRTGAWTFLQSLPGTSKIEVDSSSATNLLFLLAEGTLHFGGDTINGFSPAGAQAGGTSLNGKITMITVATNGLIFLTTNGPTAGLYRSEDHGKSFQRIGEMPQVIVHDLKVRGEGADQILLVATDKGLLFWDPATKKLNRRTSLPLNDVQRVAIGSDHQILVAGSGMIFLSSANGDTWSNVSSNIALGSFTSARFDASKNTFYLALSSGQVLAGQAFFQQIAKVKDARDLINIGNTLYIASSAGLYSLNVENIPGSQLPPLIGPNGDVSIRLQGEITLLKRGTNGIQSGNSWMAGFLAFDSLPAAIPLTARVIDRLDSLYINPSLPPKGETFVVRYGYEVNQSIAEGSPYWLIYYSKNEGPVMINQASATPTGSTLNSQALRLR